MAIMEILSLHIACLTQPYRIATKSPNVSLEIHDFCLRSVWGPFRTPIGKQRMLIMLIV